MQGACLIRRPPTKPVLPIFPGTFDSPAELGPPPVEESCAPSGNAPPPSSYQTEAHNALSLEGGINSSGFLQEAVDLFNFHHGGFLDAQAYGASPTYRNYVFGVYMGTIGYSPSFTLSAADLYGQFFSAYHNVQMSPTYTAIPAANVANITERYNDQTKGTLCTTQ